MKRDRSDEELNELVKPLDAFPLEKLPTDILLKIIFESGLSIAEIYRTCSINKKFREMINNTKLWDRVFIDRILANNKHMYSKDREQYLNHPDFIKWQEDRKTMPNDFARLLVKIMYEPSVNFSRIIEFSGVFVRDNVKVFVDLIKNQQELRLNVHRWNRNPLDKEDFEKYANFNQDVKINIEYHPLVITIIQTTVKLSSFLYAMIMDGWVLEKRPEKLVESCIKCGQKAHFKCSETNRPFCGEKCFILK